MVNKRISLKNKYCILSVIIFIEWLLSSLLTKLGVELSLWIKLIAIPPVYLPVWLLFYFLSKENRVNRLIRFIAKALVWYIPICYIAILIASLLNQTNY